MSEIKLLSYFRDQMLRFLDEIIEQFPDQPDFVFVRLVMKDKVPVDDMMGRFIQSILVEKHIVINRDLSFFKRDFVKGYENWENMNRIFNEVKKLYFSERLDEEEREVIWKWFDLFIKICEQYYVKYGIPDGWFIRDEDKDLPIILELNEKRRKYLQEHS